jgi:antitoxin (DNA-binding transcriptional repressor) of toxin-antitoxin stability system
MATIHIEEAEVIRNAAELIARARAGDTIVIENNSIPVAVMSPAVPVGRTIEECIALLPADSSATIDEDFARDVAAAIEGHREPILTRFLDSAANPS